MVIDTQTYLEALEPPVLRHEGREWRGRFLSIHEWIRVIGELERYGKNQLDLLQTEQLHRRLMDLIFPPAPGPTIAVRAWWGGTRRVPDPAAPRSITAADALLSLPFAVQQEIVSAFMNSQAHALGLELATAPALGTTTAPTMEAAPAESPS